jgi:anti-sigma factor RsiW
MTEPLQLHPADEADLVALADDCLRPCRRAELEARVAADPALATALERQRRALAMLATARPPCPTAALRARIGAVAASTSRPVPGPRRPAAAIVAIALAGVAVWPATALDDRGLSATTAAERSPVRTGGASLFVAAPAAHFVELGADGAAEGSRLRTARLDDEAEARVGPDGGPPSPGAGANRAAPRRP